MIWCMYASDPPFAAETVFQIYFQDFLTLHKIRLWLQHVFNFQPDPWRNGIQFDENILNHQLVTGGTEKNIPGNG